MTTSPGDEAPLLLVADPSPERASQLGARLRRAGFRSVHAGDARAARDAVQAHRPRLVLLDGALLCADAGAWEGEEAIVVVLVEREAAAALEAAGRAGLGEVIAHDAPVGVLEHRLRALLGSARDGRRCTLLELRRRLRAGEPVGLLLLQWSGGPGPGVLDPARLAALLGGVREPVVAIPLDAARVACVLAAPNGAADLARVAARAVDELGRGERAGGRSVRLGLGGALAPDHADTPEALLECAETACYCTLQRDRGGFQLYAAAMRRWSEERRRLELDLREALERDELELHYQPRVDAQTRALVGFEALVRWRHPELGLIAPGQFIPIAEESGRIVEIGAWVLRAACAQMRAWQEQGLEPVRVSVNLSAVQFRQEDLYEHVRAVLAQTGLAPRFLELELTESLLMDDPRAAIPVLRRLRDAGVHLSVDDFGTGYSSLSYLKELPIDALKIDQSFVRGVVSNPDDAAIATAIILMGHSLKLQVVAEGVETQTQLSFLQVLRCNEVQGFLFSPPVPAAEARRFLTERRLAAAG